jgi:hypothetical protein
VRAWKAGRAGRLEGLEGWKTGPCWDKLIDLARLTCCMGARLEVRETPLTNAQGLAVHCRESVSVPFAASPLALSAPWRANCKSAGNPRMLE